jgi:hypothetical protein
MKPLVESSRLQEFQKCSKTMLEGPLVGKWNMPKNVDLKEFTESSRVELDEKSNNKSHFEKIMSMAFVQCNRNIFDAIKNSCNLVTLNIF